MFGSGEYVHEEAGNKSKFYRVQTSNTLPICPFSFSKYPFSLQPNVALKP